MRYFEVRKARIEIIPMIEIGEERLSERFKTSKKRSKEKSKVCKRRNRKRQKKKRIQYKTK